VSELPAPVTVTFELPAPVTVTFELLMRQLSDSGYPFVGIGTLWGSRLPQVRAANDDALSDEALDADARTVDVKTAVEGYGRFRVATRGADGVVEANRDEVLPVMDEWEQRQPRLKPSTHPALCMRASVAWHLGVPRVEEEHEEITIAGTFVRDETAVADLVGLKGDPALGAGGANRYRSLASTVAKGDRLWADRGTWPWAAYDDGKVPESWWCDGHAAAALDQAIIGYVDWLGERERGSPIRMTRVNLASRARWALAVRRKLLI
jgi:hypothetical protein